MTNRAAARHRGATARNAQPTRRPVALLVAGGLGVALVVVLGIVLALAGDDGDGDGANGSGSGDAPAFGPMTVDGDPLPAFAGGTTDAAEGRVAPVLTGQDLQGGSVTVGGSGEPALVAFLAHWCPHCQAELPRLIELAAAGDLDGVRLVAVLTGTNQSAPNFPPAAWLDREGWTGEVLLDDEASTAASAFGLTEYPFLVALDAEGQVVARASGELPPEDVVALARAAQGQPQG